ncbi:MAG: hypothetical protein AAGI23_09395 [Bacteroidota bacterium]
MMRLRKDDIRSWILFLFVMALWVLASSQTGNVGTPRITYFNTVRCDSISTDNIVKFNRVACLYWHAGVRRSATQDWTQDFDQQYTVQGTVIDCVSSIGGNTATPDTLVCPWLTESGQAWILDDNSNYFQREVCE